MALQLVRLGRDSTSNHCNIYLESRLRRTSCEGLLSLFFGRSTHEFLVIETAWSRPLLSSSSEGGTDVSSVTNRMGENNLGEQDCPVTDLKIRPTVDG